MSSSEFEISVVELTEDVSRCVEASSVPEGKDQRLEYPRFGPVSVSSLNELLDTGTYRSYQEEAARSEADADDIRRHGGGLRSRVALAF